MIVFYLDSEDRTGFLVTFPDTCARTVEGVKERCNPHSGWRYHESWIAREATLKRITSPTKRSKK